MSDEGTGWREYKRLVLSQLEQHEANVTDLRATISKLETDFAVLKTKVLLASAIVSVLFAGAVSLAVKLIGD